MADGGKYNQNQKFSLYYKCMFCQEERTLLYKTQADDDVIGVLNKQSGHLACIT